MFTFDPWQLFGLKPTSTASEARRAYYKLAMIMHPDRGGNADDMRALHEAFRWVYGQLEGSTFPISIDDPTMTPVIDAVIGMDRASLEACYDRMKRTDEPRIRNMVLDWVKYVVERDLMQGKDLRGIEDYILESIEDVSKADSSMYRACVPEGYGGLMEQHQASTEYSTDPSTLAPCSVGFSKELAVYKEPICPNEFTIAEESIRIPEKKEDYSADTRGLLMTDYALAHSRHIISDRERYERERQQRAGQEQEQVGHDEFELALQRRLQELRIQK